MSMSLLLGLSMAASVMLAGLGLLWPMLGARREVRRKVLNRLAQVSPVVAPVGGGVAAPVALRRAETSWWGDILAEFSPKSADTARETRRFVLLRLGLIVSATGFGAAGFLLSGSWMGLVLGIVLPVIMAVIGLRMARARRLGKIEEAVPEALDMIVRALRIGQPVGVALQGAAKDLIGPLAEEFAIAAERISYGQGAAEALKDLAERAENQNLRFLAAAVSIQSTTGGNLADVLERLGTVARSRIATRRKINAITVESKWSGRFLSAFPLLATGGLLLVNPSFYVGVSDKDFFRPLIAGVGVLLVMNILFMRWLSQLE